MDLASDETKIRLAEIETKLADQQTQNAQMLDALNNTLRLLAGMTQQNSTAGPAHPPVQVAPAAKTKNDLKPSPPPNFNGDRHSGRGFINACQAYFRLRPDDFLDEQTKIQWAMTFMNQGRAQKWANRIYRWESIPANSGALYFVDWDDFRSRFRTEFFPLHSDAAATNRLEGISYFQGRRTVDDYLDDFRDLISDSGYTDPKTIVVKFRRGLNPTIADAVATMAAGRPDDLDPEAWYEAAIRIDQNQAANAAFRSAHNPIPQPKPFSVGTITRPPPAIDSRAASLSGRQNLPPRFAHTIPTPGNPVPMDIDAARKQGKPPPICYRCGKPGHVVHNCPQPMDIRTMGRDEADFLMGHISARMDEMDLASTEFSRIEESLPQESEEDFQSRSKK